MDATTTPSTKALLANISAQFPTISFVSSYEFKWSPSKRTIEYSATDAHFAQRLLHELAHAELDHRAYQRDIELIAVERDAWYHTKTVLGPRFSVVIDAETIENDLDTYRDWLHARSTCPHCSTTGLQTDKKTYTCVICRKTWRVNTAIGCKLRRYKKDR